MKKNMEVYVKNKNRGVLWENAKMSKVELVFSFNSQIDVEIGGIQK
jgi:hypothetical protein